MSSIKMAYEVAFTNSQFRDHIASLLHVVCCDVVCAGGACEVSTKDIRCRLNVSSWSSYENGLA